MAARLRTLQRAIRNAATPLSPDDILPAVMAEARQLVPCEAWSLFLHDLEKGELEFHLLVGAKSAPLSGMRIKLGEGIAGRCAKERTPIRSNEVVRDRRHLKTADALTGFTTRSVLAVPLVSRGRLLGVVEFLNRRGAKGFSAADEHLAASFVDVAALSIDNAFLLRKAEQLAAHDDLTGLLNARTFLERLDQEIARCRRFGGEFSLLFLDLDGFKKINDTHGHLIGSRTLAMVGGLLRDMVRATDIVSRYGGDEFCMLLTHSQAEGAAVFAERVRDAIATFPYRERLGYDIALSASIGLAHHPGHAADRSELLRKADAAMYQAKHAGKNRVMLAN